MSKLPEDGFCALHESESKSRKALDQTEWVESLRRELVQHRDLMSPHANPDEKALITSIVADLRILSHNLAVRRGEALRDYVEPPEYHYENADGFREVTESHE